MALTNVSHTHSVLNTIAFRCKVAALQMKRNIENALNADIQTRKFNPGDLDSIVAESRTPLHSALDARERSLELGKVQNLRVAVRRINGIFVPEGSTFSFWKHVGRPSRRKGFVEGRELREGCMIASVGGGICQLSNALYDAALKADFEIIERYAHSQIVPGSLAEIGRDATVFWNYIDLRFRSRVAFKIEAFLTSAHLIVRFKTQNAPVVRPGRPAAQKFESAVEINDCALCGNTRCFRSRAPSSKEEAQTTVLLSENWIEYAQYCATTFKGSQVCEASMSRRVIRALSLRIASGGAMRQQALMDHYGRLAKDYSRQLNWKAEHVVVMQDLLPYLWRAGALGGRSFDVLMTRLPYRKLHERLELARQFHPDSVTLREFRAGERLVRDEEAALQEARTIVTPHSEIADLFPGKALRLKWHVPTSFEPRINPEYVVFPFSTLARKGAYEVRVVARRLNLKLAVLGMELEGRSFWDGVDVRYFGGDTNWLRHAAVVVAPAYVEHQPRAILSAIAHGIPVIATRACGVSGLSGVTLVSFGECDALSATLQELLARASTDSARY